MNPRFFNVLQDSRSENFFAIRKSVYIEFFCFLEESIDENWMFRIDLFCFFYELLKPGTIMNECHRTATENVTGANQDRISDSLYHSLRFF